MRHLGFVLVALYVTLAASSVVQARSTAPDFNWSAQIAAGKNLEIDNVNGPIRVSRAPSSEVAVTAIREADRGDPAAVKIQVVRDSEGVVICAVYPNQGGSNQCSRRGGRHDYSVNNHDTENDTTVSFTVRLPAGVESALHTVNGSIDADNLSSPVTAAAVNGHVNVSTSSYAEAKTVNGSIHVSIGDPNWPDRRLSFASVNGSIHVTVPRSTSARVHIKTMHGSISSDVALSRHDGAMGIMQYADGVIGSGRNDLEFTTLNGSITLAKGP